MTVGVSDAQIQVPADLGDAAAARSRVFEMIGRYDHRIAAKGIPDLREVSDALDRYREAVARPLREAHIETLLDVWGQFSEPCGDGWAHDMALSTLACVGEDLVGYGVFEKHPTKDWYRRVVASGIQQNHTGGPDDGQ